MVVVISRAGFRFPACSLKGVDQMVVKLLPLRILLQYSGRDCYNPALSGAVSATILESLANLLSAHVNPVAVLSRSLPNGWFLNCLSRS